MSSISIEARVTNEASNDAHATYAVRFFSDTILTVVTRNPKAVSHHRRLQKLIVDLDTECRPTVKDEKHVALLKICVGCRCLIFQISHSVSIPDKVLDFLANNQYSFVGVGIKNNYHSLRKDYNITLGGRIEDLRESAAEVYDDNKWKDVGLSELAMKVLGKSMEKPVPVTRSNWESINLTLDQVLYATLDTFIPFQIGRLFF